MFGVYIESNNVSSKGGMYKVGKVWKDLSMLLTGGSTTESFTQSDVGTTNLSCSQVWFSILIYINYYLDLYDFTKLIYKLFLQGLILLMDSEANEDTVVTPSSKRKEHSNE
ncbi:unnamed protein product [Brassica oleracea]